MFEEPTQSNPTLSTKPVKPTKPSQSPEASKAVPKSSDKPEDIFASTEGETKAPPILGGTPAKVDEEIDREIFGSKKHSIIKPIIIGIAVIALIGGGYFAYSKFGKQFFKKAEPTEEVREVEEPTQNPPSTEVGKETPIVTPTQPTVLDSDKDGLTDQEEKKLGTNPNNSDSDQDGLPDAAEVKVYHTNPLNSDSDGDGYSDGQEVKGGYDPNDAQPGAKLGDLQAEINKLKK